MNVTSDEEPNPGKQRQLSALIHGGFGGHHQAQDLVSRAANPNGKNSSKSPEAGSNLKYLFLIVWRPASAAMEEV